MCTVTHRTILPGVRVIAIFGPTGVGKTEVAIALAERLRAAGEDPIAISADAMQVYDGLQILSGAATPEQRTRLEHRMVGVVPVAESFSAGAYSVLAHAEIDAALDAGRRPLVIGGTGLYLRAALAELDLRPPAPEARARVQSALTAYGPEALHAELARRAPAIAAAIAPADGRRLVRALELLDSGVEPPPAAGGDSQLWATDTRHPTLLAGLVMDRDALRERTDRRVDEMIAAGAIEEVKRVDVQGASSTARKALGFEELLRGDVEGMKAGTRRYVKRQLTWLRKLPAVETIDVTGRTPVDVAAELHGMIRDP
jgi:tRNA dimethylallyltransferase